jgi:hypothetical protein
MNTYMTHSRSNRLATLMRAALAVLALGLTLGGCASDSHTAQGAARGAGSGAVAGAVGGLVGSLVFGGDVGRSVARGAVVGAAVGGTAGAISGSQRDKREAQAREAELDKLRQEIGQDAFDGLEALADCRHDVSLRQATKAQQSDNPNHALAGLWLEVLSYADQRDEAKARSLFPQLVEKDWDIKTETQAEETMRSALNTLMDIRQEYKLPRVC